MNWFVFAIFAWLAVGLDAGLSELFQPFGMPIAPSFAHVLLVFVCLWAPARHAMLAALAIGVTQDMVATVPISPDSTRDVVVLGPHALGATLGASLVVNLRAVMLRRSALSMCVMTIFAAALIEIVVSATLSIRSVYPDGIHYPRPSRELLFGLGSAAYSGVLALVLAPPLNAVSGLFHFRSSGPAFPSSHR